MRGLQMLVVLTQLSVVMTSVSVSLDDVDALSCLTAKRHCLSDAVCRQRLDSIHDVCGDNSKLPLVSPLSFINRLQCDDNNCFCPDTAAKYCDQRVCRSVCLSVCRSARLHVSKTTRLNFTCKLKSFFPVVDIMFRCRDIFGQSSKLVPKSGFCPQPVGE